MSSGPFYTDSGFWQGAVAGVALILSQLPPVGLWLRRPKLTVEPYERIVLNADVGLPHAQWQLSITNVGGREIRIKKITLVFRRDGGDERMLDGRGYFEKPSDSQAIILTPFSLKPRQAWSHNVNFFKPASREVRQAFSKHVKALRENIRAKRDGLPKDGPAVEGDPELVRPFLDIYDTSFYWRPGEYEVDLRVEADSPKASTTSKYRFSLFESESDGLREHRDSLKFGLGTVWPHPEPIYHFAEVMQSAKAGS